jgi:hypothetical protein
VSLGCPKNVVDGESASRAYATVCGETLVLAKPAVLKAHFTRP